MPTAEGRPDISFVIPVRDGAAHLRRCLASIRAETNGFAAEVIVLDNGSTDLSADVARDAGARVVHVPDKTVSQVRNTAMDVAQGRLLAFVDADHELRAGWTAAALRLMADPALAAVGRQYSAPDDGTWVQRMYDRLRRHEPGARTVDWLPSGNLVVARAFFERVGGFDVSLETCEDVDLCRRLLQAGGTILASDELGSVHHGDPRTLGALFRGELWRGRDNLRVSLREPLRLRSLPGVAFPILTLLAFVAIGAGLLTWPFGGWRVAMAGALIVATLVLARAAALLRTPGPRTPGAVAQAVLFAAVYDAARALSLVARAGHGVRRGR